MSEFALIRRLAQLIGTPAGKENSAGVEVGIGDDAAVLNLPPGEQLLVTTDLLVEGSHFLRNQIPWSALGHKLMAVNLSDIAAMGGTPRFAVVNLGIDERVTVTEVETLYRGLQDLAERFETRIVGGDTVYTPTITVGLTLLGTVPVGSALLRSRAEPGDLLLVTGTLGKAAAGLEILRREVSVADGIRKQVLEAHYRPWPRVQEGRILSSLGWVHALIDISDGLASEVGHLCTQSRVGVEIWWEALPIAPSTRDVARACASCPEEWALTGGEDYELLMAVPADRVEATQEALQKIGCALTAVGRIRPRDEGGTLVHPEGRWPLDFKGYDHFRS